MIRRIASPGVNGYVHTVGMLVLLGSPSEKQDGDTYMFSLFEWEGGATPLTLI